mgnify:CR=1 FL=1
MLRLDRAQPVTAELVDVLGLRMDTVPAEFLARWMAYGKHIATTQPAAVALTVLGLVVIVALRRWKPGWPGFLIALLAVSSIAQTNFLQSAESQLYRPTYIATDFFSKRAARRLITGTTSAPISVPSGSYARIDSSRCRSSRRP